MSELAIVIPCLNQQASLEILLPAVQRVVRHFRMPADVVIVDGGSTDGTIALAKNLNVPVIRQRGPGYGGALRTAIADVDADYIITLEADGSHPPVLLNCLYQARHSAAVVIASRYVAQGFARMPQPRRLLSLALNAAFGVLLDLPIHDLSSGYRLYNRMAVASLDLEVSSYAILQEILIKTYCEGYRILEVPMHYSQDAPGRNQARLWRLGVDYVRTFRAMWRLRNSTDSGDYDTRAFSSRIPLQRWWQRRRYSILLDYIGDRLRVLDAGCGSTQLLNGAPQIIGLDPQMRKLRFVRAPGRRLVNGSTDALPFANESFEVVISSQVIEHLPADDRIFHELVRCLTPGGFLVVGTVDYGAWQWPLIERIYAFVKPTGYADEHITHYTRRSLLDRLKGMGLDIQEVRSILGGEIIVKARKPEGAADGHRPGRTA
jgi:dolichol-phosphate mannosyltransferase